MSETKPKKKILRMSEKGVYLKKVIYEIIVMRGNTPRHIIWAYRSEDFPCGSCHSYDDVAFMISESAPTHSALSRGVYWTCTKCGITYEVEAKDSSNRIVAKLYQDKEVSRDEAVAICKRIEQPIPYALQAVKKGQISKEELEEQFGE